MSSDASRPDANESTSKIVALLEGQIEDLKNDKQHLHQQVQDQAEQIGNVNQERGYLIQDWQKVIRENDSLRRQLSAGKPSSVVNPPEFTPEEITPKPDPVSPPDAEEQAGNQPPSSSPGMNPPVNPA